MLSGPVFFKLAWRLDSYQGAVLAAAESEAALEELSSNGQRRLPIDAPMEYPDVEVEEEEEVLEGRVLTAEELERQYPAAPTIGQDVGLFEVTKVS
jgi:hypothetical protein